jgi:hypothetical protein
MRSDPINTPTLRERQVGFGDAILDSSEGTPRGLVAPRGTAASRRFNIYRNNVFAGLVAALRDAYPVVWRLVGDEFFRVMAREYVKTHPPTSPVMFRYGSTFPEYVRNFPPAKVVPYLADVALLEWAWIESSHAAESTSLDAVAFAAVYPGELSVARPQMHPSVRVVQSCFPVLTIWTTHRESGAPRELDLESGGEDVLIVRPGSEVLAYRLPHAAALLVQTLRSGVSFSTAIEGTIRAHADLDLAATLTLLLQSGAIANLWAGAAPPPPTSTAA